ncbi:hypothetical protein DRJ48_00345 [Candidatus Woesearchaeota archaeon]|nr:hypothetical protein [Candidatus Woesearchaeota archaeon]RLE43614.1 MAG: hypothetical protein DRJ48_00345 [Candidatus Woesearchaeota archaeon]
MNPSKLTELRKQLKSRIPKFRRQNLGLKKRLKPVWRRPRGVQSKLRLKKKSRGYLVSIGYKLPEAVRGMIDEGLVPVRIANLSKLEELDNKSHCVLLDGRLGLKKKLLIMEAALKKGFKILNYKDPEGYVKQKREELEAKKKETKEKKEKKKPTKKTIDEKLEKSIEDKKKLEKFEKDKVLTKRQ